MGWLTEDQESRFKKLDSDLRALEARLILQQDADGLTPQRVKTALANHYLRLAASHACEVASMENRTPRLWRWARACYGAWKQTNTKAITADQILRYVVTVDAIRRSALSTEWVPVTPDGTAISKAKGDV